MRSKWIIVFLFLTAFMVSARDIRNQAQSAQLSTNREARESPAVEEGYKYFVKKITCPEEMVVKSLVSGSVSQVLVTPGDRVQMGQLLVRMDCTELEQEKNGLEESLKKWEAILFKREHWKERSDEAETRAREKIDQLRAEIKESERQIFQKQIRSLIDGVVVDIISHDAVVKEDTAIARIADDRMLEILLSKGEDLNREEWAQMKQGEKIPLTFDGINVACSGEVSKKGSRIIIRIPNDKQNLVPGLKARFRIQTGPPLPPQDEIQDQSGKEMEPAQTGKMMSKKIDFEVSTGISYSDPGDFFFQASGIEAQVEQFIENYGLEYSVSGGFDKKRFYFPVSGTVNYRVSNQFYIKGGLEFGYGSQTGQKDYTLNWGSFSEEIRYDLSSTVIYFLPYVGAETRFGNLGLYGNLCFNYLSLSNHKESRISDPVEWVEREDDISANGTGFGIILGVKYVFQMGKKMNLLVKLEYCYLKIGSLSGTRDSFLTNSTGESVSEAIDGTLYSFEANPYDLGWFSSWDLFNSAPGESWIRNVNELSYNFSSIRLQVGFVF